MSTTHRMDGPLLPGYHHMGDRGQGVLADSIPGTGTNGPAIPVPSLAFPADSGKEIMIRIDQVPPLLTLFDVDELGRVTAEGPPGIHQGLFTGWADGDLFTPNPQATFYVLIGSSGYVTGSLTTDDAVASGNLANTAPGQLTGNIQGDDSAAAGQLGVNPPSVLDGAVQAGDAAGSGGLTGYVEPVAIIGRRVVVVGTRQSPTRLEGLNVAEIDDIAFRFGGILLAGESVLGYTFTADPQVGVDARPAPLKVGEPQKFGSDCIQRVDGSLAEPGVTYLLLVVAALSSGRQAVGRALIRVVRA